MIIVCHIVGNYRGAAHSRCILAYRISKSDWKLSVVIHNLKGYDGHLIGEVGVIPQNMEKYLSITVETHVHPLSPIHFSESGQSREDARS